MTRGSIARPNRPMSARKAKLEAERRALTQDACRCGSGEPDEAAYDARGIFLAYVCNRCRSAVLGRYRRDVLEDPQYWHDEPLDDE